MFAPLEPRPRVRKLKLLLGLPLLIGFVPPSNALLTMTLQAQTGDVVLTADGSLDLSAASLAAEPTDCGGAVEAGGGSSWAAVVGPPQSATVTCDIYTAAITGPAGFGVGAATLASSGGDVYAGIGSFASTLVLGVPNGYVSGAPLSGSSRFRNTTLEGLGAQVGTYTWSWGSGSQRDSVVLRVIGRPPAAGIPTLSFWASCLLVASLLAVGVSRVRRW